MKHCFIINPAAGNGKDQQLLLPRILDAVKKCGADYEVHRTSGPGEATVFTRGRLAASDERPIRFYACGGDGTAAEVLNGMYGVSGVELAMIPAGSGNDYIRNFDGRERFMDIAAQLAGAAVPVDVVKYIFTPMTRGDAGEVTAYALNMINMGFDAKVVRHMERLKNKFFLKGTSAYVAGIVRELAAFKMSRAVFRLDGGEPFESDILLAGVGSGRFSGGGFDGVPVAVVNDGYLDLLIIDPVKRMKFLSLVGAYHDGKHMENPELAKVSRLFRLKEADIEPVSPLIFTADGEVNYTAQTLRISVAPEKVSFVIPDGVQKP